MLPDTCVRMKEGKTFHAQMAKRFHIRHNFSPLTLKQHKYYLFGILTWITFLYSVNAKAKRGEKLLIPFCWWNKISNILHFFAPSKLFIRLFGILGTPLWIEGERESLQVIAKLFMRLEFRRDHYKCVLWWLLLKTLSNVITF